MTPSKRSCFVHLQLPGTLEPVVCGRYERETLRDGRVVGRFVYGRSYRARPDAVPVDPYNLPLVPTRYETARLDGMFGALRDASPDAWGRRVIEKMTGRSDLDEFDYLIHANADRTGALSFTQSAVSPAPKREFNGVLQLAMLRGAAAAVEDGAAGEPLPAQIAQLVDPGSSLGGARPKNVVEDAEGLWIAKFPQRGDKWPNATVEAAMLTLATRCGIHVPEHRVEQVGGESVLLVKRFDRERFSDGYLRHRMVSALTVLDAEDRVTDRSNWSYLLLADELRRWSERPVDDREQLFRRVVFNALISNIDDHPRNHAMIAPGRAWQLAPAYDLTPHPAVSNDRRDLAMECGPFGRMARRDNLLAGAARFGLDSNQATAIIDTIKGAIGARWQEDVQRFGGTSAERDEIAPAFNYEGFEYPT